MKKFANMRKPARKQTRKAAVLGNAAFAEKLAWCKYNLEGVVNTPTRKAYTCEVYQTPENEELRVWFWFDKPTLYQY